MVRRLTRRSSAKDVGKEEKRCELRLSSAVFLGERAIGWRWQWWLFRGPVLAATLVGCLGGCFIHLLVICCLPFTLTVLSNIFCTFSFLLFLVKQRLLGSIWYRHDASTDTGTHLALRLVHLARSSEPMIYCNKTGRLE